jgi:hypothetical protein
VIVASDGCTKWAQVKTPRAAVAEKLTGLR